MHGVGRVSPTWAMRRTPDAADPAVAVAVAGAVAHGFDVVEIALPDPDRIDAGHSGAPVARTGRRDIHLVGSRRGMPGAGGCDRDEIFATRAAIGCTGGTARESFEEMSPERVWDLSALRPVAETREAVIGQGLPFQRDRAGHHGLPAGRGGPG